MGADGGSLRSERSTASCRRSWARSQVLARFCGRESRQRRLCRAANAREIRLFRRLHRERLRGWDWLRGWDLRVGGVRMPAPSTATCKGMHTTPTQGV